MQVEVQAVAPEQVEADVLAIPLAAGESADGALARLDGPLDGLLTRLVGEGELRDELGRAAVVHVDGKLGAHRVAGAGVGPREHVDADALRTAAAAVVHAVGGFAERIAWAIDGSLPLSPAEQARALIDGTLLGAYEPARWKRDDEPAKLATLVLCGDADGLAETAARATTIA
jgi:leucyl aminopeptidase